MMTQKALEVLVKKQIYNLLMFWWGNNNKIASFALNFLGNKVKYTLIIFKYLQCHQAKPLNEEVLYSSFHLKCLKMELCQKYMESQWQSAQLGENTNVKG